MMNRFIYLFLLLGCVASALVGCTDDPNVEPLSPGRGNGESWVTIDFCDNSFDEINITTRATLDNIAESRVGNLFVFLFNRDGDRLYGRYFDYTNRVNSDADLLESKVECWWVADNATTKEPSGKVRILAPAITEGCSLYILANVNADMVNISPDKLRFVHTLADLKALTATLNQTITERNGFFPMTGWADGIGISGDNITIPDGNGNRDGKILLTRLDAKIEVKVRVAKGYMGINDTGTISTGETGSDELGEDTSDKKVKTTHTIDEFVPLSWQVVNLPRSAFVLPSDVDATNEDGKKEMFNTRETKFETRKPVTFPYVQEIIKKKADGTFEYDYEYETDENGNYITDGKGNKIPKKSTRDSIATTDEHGFSFYMLENRHDPDNNKYLVNGTATGNNKPLIEDNNYHLRDTRNKNAAGAYDTSKGLWEYAPEEGTYLVIKGEIVMALDLENEGKNQQLSADVVYYIHLGNFGRGIDTDGDGTIDVPGNINNYDIERNTSYTYTITIYGVDNIQIEVEKHEENESGATGHVYVAKEQIFTFDSHYGRAVVSFDAGHLTDLVHMTWYVRTPFGREGRPHIINGVEVPAGLDYRWVEFKRNRFTTDENGNEVYSQKHEKYDSTAVKDVLEFSKYIKEQKALFDKDMEDGKNDHMSDFRPEEDADWKAKFPNDPTCWMRHRIYLTIFVDEFYYDANPLTGDVRQDLWKDFVNQPHRLMHILCDADKSLDEASLTTGSVVTIRQRSIQTIFNTEKPELKTAWGCETIDETRDVLWYYTRKEEKYVQAPREDGYPEGYMIWQKPSDMPDDLPTGWNAMGNDSQGNGLYNTAKIWGLTTGSEYTAKAWNDYVDYDELYALKDDDEIETLRYSCMTRNRDENGNGLIDAMEVKWYMAAISQLASLYVGDQGLSSEAVLYPYYKQAEQGNVLDDKLGAYKWRAHIVSSTVYDKNPPYYPEIMWAEEGLSTGSYKDAYGKSAPLTVRCLRNLGMDPSTEKIAQSNLKNPDNISQVAVQMTGPSENDANLSSVYKFDMTNLNPLSIRYYTSQELEPNDEYSVESRVYWGFETGVVTDKAYSYNELYQLIRDGKSPCPDGYRTPNIREGALMSLRCPRKWQQEQVGGDLVDINSRVSTYYSHGLPPYGNDQDPGAVNVWKDDKNVGHYSVSKSCSWFFNGDKTYLDHGGVERVRCVKDIRQ